MVGDPQASGFGLGRAADTSRPMTTDLGVPVVQQREHAFLELWGSYAKALKKIGEKAPRRRKRKKGKHPDPRGKLWVWARRKVDENFAATCRVTRRIRQRGEKRRGDQSPWDIPSPRTWDPMSRRTNRSTQFDDDHNIPNRTPEQV